MPGRWPLPLTDRLTAVLASRFAGLPERTQAALLLAAVADGPDLNAAASRGAEPDARALAPAEQLGLVKIGRTGLQFSHPLVRSAVYHSALLEATAAQAQRRGGAAAAALADNAHARITEVSAPHLAMVSDPGVVTSVILQAVRATT